MKVQGEGGQDGGQILVPVFEDAQSLQMMVRQVAMLVLEGKIDNKRAGLVLYAVQIASSNLRRMEEEKPRPEQVVVDTEKVAETPVGMTPWSKKAEGHEIEEPAEAAWSRTLREVNGWWEREYREKKEWIEERLHEIDRVLAKHPAPKDDELFSELSSVSTTLELVSKSMKERLEQWGEARGKRFEVGGEKRLPALLVRRSCACMRAISHHPSPLNSRKMSSCLACAKSWMSARWKAIGRCGSRLRTGRARAIGYGALRAGIAVRLRRGSAGSARFGSIAEASSTFRTATWPECSAIRLRRSRSSMLTRERWRTALACWAAICTAPIARTG